MNVRCAVAGSSKQGLSAGAPLARHDWTVLMQDSTWGGPETRAVLMFRQFYGCMPAKTRILLHLAVIYKTARGAGPMSLFCYGML